MKHKATEIVDAVTQMYADLQEIAGLTSRVLAKFPNETVPQQLRAFLGSPRVAFARPSMTGDGKITLRLERGLSQVQTQIPDTWLALHQSELTAAVREIYWGEQEHIARHELIRLGKVIAEHNSEAQCHRHKASEALREYDRLAASIRRRSARKRSGMGGDSDS